MSALSRLALVDRYVDGPVRADAVYVDRIIGGDYLWPTLAGQFEPDRHGLVPPMPLDFDPWQGPLRWTTVQRTVTGSLADALVDLRLRAGRLLARCPGCGQTGEGYARDRGFILRHSLAGCPSPLPDLPRPGRLTHASYYPSRLVTTGGHRA